MLRRFRERSAEPELMDAEAAGGIELREAYRHLRRLNRLFGTARPVLYGVRRLWAEAGYPARLTVLDIGAGAGDVNRLLLRWADRQGIRLNVILADRRIEACREAKRLFKDERRVRIMLGDLFDLPNARADIVTATHFAHHFAPDELPDVVRRMLRASRLGAVLCDIHRHWVPWASVWLAARLISRNRYIRHDGPLSVAKGFRTEDWRVLREALDDCELECRWRPLFRYVALVRRRTAPDGEHRTAGLPGHRTMAGSRMEIGHRTAPDGDPPVPDRQPAHPAPEDHGTGRPPAKHASAESILPGRERP